MRAVCVVLHTRECALNDVCTQWNANTRQAQKCEDIKINIAPKEQRRSELRSERNRRNDDNDDHCAALKSYVISSAPLLAHLLEV